MKHLLKSLQNNTYNSVLLDLSIGEFDEGYTSITDEDIITLLNALNNNNIVTSINLSGNKITYVGATILAQSHLKELNLSNNLVSYRPIMHYEFNEMIEAFSNNKTIISLNLAYNSIPDKMIAKLIASNSTIRNLTVGKNLTDAALETLKNNNCLQKLEVFESKLTDKSVEFLIANKTITSLYISDSVITDSGVKLLSTHTSLKNCGLINSNITKEGTSYFLDSNIDNLVLFNPTKNQFISNQELRQFSYTFAAHKYQQKLNAQQEYYYQLTNNQQYLDVNPDMNDIDSIQHAIDIVQWQSALYDDWF